MKRNRPDFDGIAIRLTRMREGLPFYLVNSYLPTNTVVVQLLPLPDKIQVLFGNAGELLLFYLCRFITGIKKDESKQQLVQSFHALKENQNNTITFAA